LTKVIMIAYFITPCTFLQCGCL